MSSSYSYSESATFTVTHARHMAAKVATDLKRMQRFYGSPSDANIARYEAEVTEFLKAGYLGSVTYGFRRDENWIEPTLRYTARDLAGGFANDDDPGRVRANANVSGATFYSYLTYNSAWDRLTHTAKEAFESQLPLQRSGAPEPGITGYLSDDRIYSSGGRALNRASVRSY
ncbi:HORMA-1 domain-containing protein [Methylorubrum populi]